MQLIIDQKIKLPVKINGKQYVMDYVIVPSLRNNNLRCFQYSPTEASHKLFFPNLCIHYTPCDIVLPLKPLIWQPCKIQNGTRIIFLLHATAPWKDGMEHHNINTSNTTRH